MQNVTYPTRERALASPSAPFQLGGCETCGFMLNTEFDGSLFNYDAAYDNHVESEAFARYYRGLASELIERFDLGRGGIVYDVGCGKGTFLKTLCAMAPNLRGVGIDPSCVPEEAGNVTLIQSAFSPELIDPNAKLVLLRHVLEHIERPLEFMKQLKLAVHGAPLFVEVPETSWIFSQGAFWDFCYEHCNYFVPETLKEVLTLAGFTVREQQVSFGGQYQWAICSAGDAQNERRPERILAAARAYAGSESRFLEQTQSILREASRKGACAIWGMATKGVVLASLIDADLIAGGVDSNVRKQGRYAPGSGVAIHSPDWLAQFGGRVTAFVMNPNYLSEIRAQTIAAGIVVYLQTF
jgi:hypothetical protein